MQLGRHKKKRGGRKEKRQQETKGQWRENKCKWVGKKRSLVRVILKNGVTLIGKYNMFRTGRKSRYDFRSEHSLAEI